MTLYLDIIENAPTDISAVYKITGIPVSDEAEARSLADQYIPLFFDGVSCDAFLHRHYADGSQSCTRELL